jgi:predicted phage gp36 major capsid-like protein
MEPFEWLILGIGIVIGGLFGAKGKGVVKTAAKGYLAAGEKAQEWTANLREDFRDAVEEAKYEREKEEALRREEHEAHHESLVDPAAVKADGKAVSRRTAAAHAEAKASE